jgi:hypothetical protein
MASSLNTEGYIFASPTSERLEVYPSLTLRALLKSAMSLDRGVDCSCVDNYNQVACLRVRVEMLKIFRFFIPATITRCPTCTVWEILIILGRVVDMC